MAWSEEDLRDLRARATAGSDQVIAGMADPAGIEVLERLAQAIYAYIQLLRAMGLPDAAIASSVAGACAGATHMLLDKA